MTDERWVLYPGHGRIPDAAAPDIRARSYAVTAEIRLERGDESGVLVAHGDRHMGYALYVDRGRLVHDYVRSGTRSTVASITVLPAQRWISVGIAVQRRRRAGEARLTVDGQVVASGLIPELARERIGWTGLDVGCDRGLTVGDYPAPARWQGRLRRIIVTAEPDQDVDTAAAWLLDAAMG